MHVDYLGELRIEATHYSGSKLITDAPVDNQGKGESFSPTDLLCTALATCMITIMGIRARKLNVPFEGVTADIRKFMGENPRRVIKAEIVINMPPDMESRPERAEIEDAGLHCPVALSLHPDLEQKITFLYGQK
jgi:uncharacterized OsmC-like protein